MISFQGSWPGSLWRGVPRPLQKDPKWGGEVIFGGHFLGMWIVDDVVSEHDFFWENDFVVNPIFAVNAVINHYCQDTRRY